MKVITVFNSKQRLMELSDGSRWYVNGLPDEVKEELGVKKRNLYSLSLFHHDVNIYYHDRITDKYDENPLSTILAEIKDIKQPSQSTVKRAMIWNIHYPGEKPHYAIKAGGESRSDNLFESDYCPTVIGNDFNDTRIFLIKRFSSEFSKVLITKEIVQELYLGCMSSKQINKKLQSDREDVLSILIGTKRNLRRNGTTGIKNAMSLTFEEVFEKMKEHYILDEKIVPLAKKKIDRINYELDFHYGADRSKENIYQIGPNDTYKQKVEASRNNYIEQMNRISDLKAIIKALNTCQEPVMEQMAMF